MAPKTAMKAMKTATKSPKSGRRGPAHHTLVGPRRWERKTNSSTSSTGSSTSSSSASVTAKLNKSAPDEFKLWTGKGWGTTVNKQIPKPKAEPNPVTKKIPQELKKKPAAAPEKSKKDESELARLTDSEWSSPSQYHMQ